MSLIQHITTIAKAFCKKPLCVIVLAALALYANTLFHDYAYDDAVVITDSQYTQKGVQGIPEILTHGGFEGHQETEQCLLVGGRYRPMAQVFFAIEYELFGLNPFVGHLMNVLYYALLCALIFVVLRRLFDNRAPSPYLTLPFVATMVFLVHPLHTEVVANIKGRDEILAMLGAMGALYFSLNYVTGHRITTLMGVFLAFLFGLLSKENTLTFLVVIPLTMYMFLKRRSLSGVEGRSILAMLLAATVVYLALRYNAVGYWIGDTNQGGLYTNPFLYATSAERLATVLFTWLIYFKLLFIPYPLTYDYYPFQLPLVDFSDYRVWLSLLMVVLLVYAVIRNFKKNPVVTYGILFFVITFSMMSNVVFNIGTFMNDRFLFVPLLGFGMIVGYYVQRWAASVETGHAPSLQGKKQWVLPIVLMAVGLTLSSLTIHRNRVWKDNFTLFTTDVGVSSRSVPANTNAAKAWMAYAETLQSGSVAWKKAMEQAYQHFRKVADLDASHKDIWAWFGINCFYLERYAEAYDAFERAIRMGVADRGVALYAAQQLEQKGEKAWAERFRQLALTTP